jgi:hypothetical protein
MGSSEEFEGRAAYLHDLVALLGEVEEALASPNGISVERQSGPSRRFAPDPFRMKIALRSGVAVIAAFLIPMATRYRASRISRYSYGICPVPADTPEGCGGRPHPKSAAKT